MSTPIDEAKALITTQLYTTRLECDTSLFLEYANMMDQVIAALATKDPRIVYQNGAPINVGEAIIDGYLQIELIDLSLDGTRPVQHHTMVNGDALDTTRWRVDNVAIDMHTVTGGLNPLPGYIDVEQVDYLIDPVLTDEDDFKYSRTYLVIIYLN